MARHILPLADILRENFMLEYVFDFYDGGFRGLLRDHVLISSALVCDIWFEDIESEPDPLEKKITEFYQTKVGAAAELANIEQIQLKQALDQSRCIRMQINRMMHAIFRNDVYHVDEHQYRWLGNDIVVYIDHWD